MRHLIRPPIVLRCVVVLAAVLAAGQARAEPKRVSLGKNVTLVVDGPRHRWVEVDAQVCQRESIPLEHLLCRKNSKEHEAILSADVDGRDVHKALNAAGAKEGTPFQDVSQTNPKPKLATGSRIRITLEYEAAGQQRPTRVPAGEWVRNAKTKKMLDTDWVFGGSHFVPNPNGKDKPDYYVANDGDLITLCNFDSAMLDLPFISSKNNDVLSFEPNTEKIPALQTRVTIILEPVQDEKQ